MIIPFPAVDDIAALTLYSLSGCQYPHPCGAERRTILPEFFSGALCGRENTRLRSERSFPALCAAFQIAELVVALSLEAAHHILKVGAALRSCVFDRRSLYRAFYRHLLHLERNAPVFVDLNDLDADSLPLGEIVVQIADKSG